MVTNKHEIDVNYWVSMTDKFLSGWGMADKKINKLVIECSNYDEALIVEQNARNRSEMKNVNICTTKPRYNEERYYVSEHNKNDYSSWFIAGKFKREDR